MNDKSFSTESNMVLGKAVDPQNEYSPDLLHHVFQERKLDKIYYLR